jgi:chorismate lyase / 3-hydroxybenzoate synthase
MVFNSGRFRAFNDWFGSRADVEQSVATASATGHWGRDLVVHCLASESPGVAVNNPRQVAPYHYSERFGPLPPCFARATKLRHDATTLLFVGGTASVRGEDSMHAGDLVAQCRETFVNLAALIATATNQKPAPTIAKPAPLLAAFREARVYHPDPADEPRILWMIRENFPALARIELLPADLCRPELLVEIEGIADLNGR